MKPASKTKVWSNADVALQTAASIESQVQGVGLKAKAVVKAVQSKKHGGEGVFLAKTHVKFDDSDDDDGDEDIGEYQTLPSTDTAKTETDAPKVPSKGESVGAYIRARQADDDEVCQRASTGHHARVLIRPPTHSDGRLYRIAQKRTANFNEAAC